MNTLQSLNELRQMHNPFAAVKNLYRLINNKFDKLPFFIRYLQYYGSILTPKLSLSDSLKQGTFDIRPFLVKLEHLWRIGYINDDEYRVSIIGYKTIATIYTHIGWIIRRF